MIHWRYQNVSRDQRHLVQKYYSPALTDDLSNESGLSLPRDSSVRSASSAWLPRTRGPRSEALRIRGGCRNLDDKRRGAELTESSSSLSQSLSFIWTGIVGSLLLASSKRLIWWVRLGACGELELECDTWLAPVVVECFTEVLLCPPPLPSETTADGLWTTVARDRWYACLSTLYISMSPSSLASMSSTCFTYHDHDQFYFHL